MAVNFGFALGPGWKALLDVYGIPPEVVLGRAGLPEDLLQRHDTRLPAESFLRFFRAVQDALGDPAAIVDIVERIRPEWFNPPVFAALCSADLTMAARRLSRFKPLVAPIGLQVDEHGDGLTLTLHWLESAVAPPVFLQAFEALFLVRLARIGTHHRVEATRVTLMEQCQAEEAFEAFLGVPVQVGSHVSVSFSAEDAARPFLSANHDMWSIFEPALRRRLSDLEGSATFEQRTRAILLEGLPSGQTSVDVVAKRLAVSSRTLQRRLKQEDTSFKEVVQRTRESLAHYYLGQTTLTATEIAYLLGFEEPTSFFRAFHDWTGETPERVRQSLQAGQVIVTSTGAS